MPRIFKHVSCTAALLAVTLLPLSAQAGVSESEAARACQERIRSQVPGAEFPKTQNWGDGNASHYFTWTGEKRVNSTGGKTVPASCVLNLETMKLYVTVSGRDLPAVKYTPKRGAPASMR
jgi:hypothetical protein